MIRKIVIAAALLLAACDQNQDSVMQEIQRGEAEDAAQGAGAAEAAQTLPSGLVLEFTHRGENQSLAQPTMNAQVLVHYEGSLVANGTVFDSSFERGEPAQFPLQGVVPGFAEAITHMKPGDEVIATFPAPLGYGAEGRPPAIPPNSALRFRIQLRAFQDGPNAPVVRAPEFTQQ